MADNVVALDGVDDMLVIGPADKFETELIIWSSSSYFRMAALGFLQAAVL